MVSAISRISATIGASASSRLGGFARSVPIRRRSRQAPGSRQGRAHPAPVAERVRPGVRIPCRGGAPLPGAARRMILQRRSIPRRPSRARAPAGAEEAEVPHRVHGPRGGAAARLGRLVLRPGRRLQARPEDGRAGARDLPRAAVVLGREGRRAVRRDRVRPALQAAVDRAAERPVRDRERPRVRERRRAGLPVRLGDDLPVRPRGRRVHHRDDEDRRDPDRDRAPGVALPPQRLGPDRDPHGRLRARRDDLRDVGGDARLLRPARPADARARLRPDRRRLDHLPRRRLGRAVLDGQPVRDRRRVRRRGHQPRRRHRPALRHVGRAGGDGDRVRAALRAPGQQGPGAVDRRHLAVRRGGRAEPDPGRAQPDRAPEARPRALHRRVRRPRLRVHPVERPVAGGVGQGLPAADLRAPSTSPRPPRCSSSWRSSSG